MTAKRFVTVLAAALFTLPVGAGVASALPAGAGPAATDRDDNYWYHYYCDKNSRGYNWDYCWSHYKDWYQRDHGYNNNGGHNR
ncbi:hypothetical protein [Nocardia huaxiensis]|uniref:Uncharacterized protein n=1 Tax=Nocardia huaxiensis TaxID=2755382 RepID=A0A7D6VGE9_9NOCA|nr:hypothetical protein [Nocardia huaxiensis]QLY32217.1 hypothetical protein H0264_08070 [Nocardia huaxiensis]UFS94080.1 hypothetical protein LPY97_25325 [Nocardia huaxiensis]